MCPSPSIVSRIQGLITEKKERKKNMSGVDFGKKYIYVEYFMKNTLLMGASIPLFKIQKGVEYN